MSEGMVSSVFYFEKKGAVNTEKTLEIALTRAAETKIGKIVVASSTGETALKLHQMAADSVKIINAYSENKGGSHENSSVCNRRRGKQGLQGT